MSAEARAMLGEVLNAIGVPAAVIRVGPGLGSTVEAANDSLCALLGQEAGLLGGFAAAALLPTAILENWAEHGPAEPVDTRLGSAAVLCRALAREVPSEIAGE